jgi:glycosyltransferase involved in cell wall biosynthesis
LPPVLLQSGPVIQVPEPAEAVQVKGQSGVREDATSPARCVLMVAPTSFFADYGCHVRILEEARALRTLGHRVTIATYYTGRDMDGLDIRRTLAIPWRRDYAVGSSRHKIAFDALLAARVLPLAVGLRPDVVHGHLHEGALIGGIVARLIGRPLVFDFQGSMSSEMVDHGFLTPGSRTHAAAGALERRVNRMADAIVTSTHHGARLLRDTFGVAADKIHSLPDQVNVEAFRPGLLPPGERRRLRSHLGIPDERTVVVYLGLLARYQGTDLLIEAAARAVAERPDLHFLVMGFPGPHVYQARAHAMGLAGHVTFPGRIPYEEAPKHLALGDIAVGPKQSATEGSGKLLNYMAMGLPVVAFDTSVSREYLGRDGTYAVPGSASSLAACILELAAGPDRAREQGLRLRHRAETTFGWQRAVHRLLDVYEQLRPASPTRSEGRAQA